MEHRKLARLVFLAPLLLLSPATDASSKARPTAPQAQQCVINGGTNTNVVQNCIVNPTPPPIVLLEPGFEPPEPKGDQFVHRLLVRLTATEDLILVACGEVTDVNARPFPAGMYIGPDVGTVDGCMAKRYQNLAAGKWKFEVTTPEADSKFTLSPKPE
jgi:hypothetical protein